jgi:hypothetical protein
MAVMAGGALAASFALFAATRHGLRRDEKKAPAVETARAIAEEDAL